MSYIIWHNPRCRKSRDTLKLLEENGISPEVRLYLKETPTVEELKRSIKMLGVEPRGLMRTKEALYRELGLKDPSTSSSALLEAMANHPALIERPLVIHGDQAVLGRPPENVLALI